MNTWNWLHLSDFHLGFNSEFSRWGNIESAFCKDLEKLHERCGPWDMILFTGDLVFSGQENEFTKLNDILERIYTCLDRLQEDRPPLIAVPGNHDLTRPDHDDPAAVVLTELWDNRRDIRDMFWSDPECKYREIVNKAFTHYKNWIQSEEFPFPRPTKITWGKLPGDFSCTIERNGSRFGIVGLNTALLQLTSGDYLGRLAVNHLQLSEICTDFPDDWMDEHDIRLLMYHHPPSWLNTQAKKELDGEIAVPGRFAIQLFGHQHEHRGETVILGGGEPRRCIQASSLFGLPTWGEDEQARTHGYSAGQLTLTDTAKGEWDYRLWPRSAELNQSGNWRFGVDRSYDTTADDAIGPERICLTPRMQLTTPTQPKPQQPVVDGIPTRYVFDYEKDIIDAYTKNNGVLTDDFVQKGCPRLWPEVKRIENPGQDENPLTEKDIGPRRSNDSMILVDARRKRDGDVSTCPLREALAFPEAGPREHICFTSRNDTLRVGILVSGGIAPGINAVINGIVERHHQYAKSWRRKHKDIIHGKPRDDVQVYGYIDGFKDLMSGRTRVLLDVEEVGRNATLGGSMIGISRADELLDYDHPKDRFNKIAEVARKLAQEIDILYVIGGDGSMRAAHALWDYSNKQDDCQLSVVGVPKTMDNDILWVWQSFGFVSAVERARQSIMQLYTEITSNPRVCVIQLFGSDSGFVVSHAVLGSGVCDLALIPEIPFTMKEISSYIKEKLEKRLWMKANEGKNSPYSMVVMAETAIPQDVDNYIDDPDVALTENEKYSIRSFVARGRRVYGQTPDDLRSAGLKIVSRVLQKEIRKMEMDRENPYWYKFRVFTNEPRHLIRSMQPSVKDVIFGQRLGTLAVDNAVAGYTDFMVSQWLTEFVLVPLELVVVGRKRVPKEGIFWKSVIANTGQPANLGCGEEETLNNVVDGI